MLINCPNCGFPQYGDICPCCGNIIEKKSNSSLIIVSDLLSDINVVMIANLQKGEKINDKKKLSY